MHLEHFFVRFAPLLPCHRPFPGPQTPQATPFRTLCVFSCSIRMQNNGWIVDFPGWNPYNLSHFSQSAFYHSLPHLQCVAQTSNTPEVVTFRWVSFLFIYIGFNYFVFEFSWNGIPPNKACVRWGSAVSDSFFVTNGVRQEGILSPLLFNVYMDGLSSSLSNTPIVCSICGVMVNHIMLMTWSSSVRLPKDCNACWTLCAVYGQTHAILFNDDKTVCMYMPAKSSFYINTLAGFLNG